MTSDADPTYTHLEFRGGERVGLAAVSSGADGNPQMLSDVGQTHSPPEALSGHVPQGGLPPRLRLLCLAPREPSWVSLSLQLDRVGCHEPQFRWVAETSAVLAVLRKESFDCIVIGSSGDNSSNPNQNRQFVEMLRAIRASGCDDPAVFVAPNIDDETSVELTAANCSVLVSASIWESRALVVTVQRELARVELIRENRRLTISQHRRMVRERDEAEHLLDQQRRIIQDLGGLIPLREPTSDAASETHSAIDATTSFSLPPEINNFYTELLRTYVIMGSGNLGNEIAQLADVIAVAGLSTRETLELHIERVESLVQGLGNRSSRHVMARADLLALELMIHLGDCYFRASRGETSAA